MIFRILIITGLLCSISCLQSCKSTSKAIASADTKTKPVNILLKDAGKTFRLEVNENFDATFNECIGCPGLWKITKIDSTKIDLLSETYSNKSCIDCIGGNQDKTFHFFVKAPGKSAISFAYFTKDISVIIDGY